MKIAVALGIALFLPLLAQAGEGTVRGKPLAAAHAAPEVEGECVLMPSMRRNMPMFTSKSEAAEVPDKHPDFKLMKRPPVPIMTGLSSFSYYD